MQNTKLDKTLEEAGRWLERAAKEPETEQESIRHIIELFENQAKKDSGAWFFLGTMYMPKINRPFPDDTQKSLEYFQKVKREAGIYWANAMSQTGMIYYQQKKDYLRAAAYFSLALQYDNTAKQVKNYYDLALGRIQKRTYWLNQMEQLKDQNDVEQMLEKGKKDLTLSCPKCKSTEIRKASMLDHLRKSLSGKVGLNRYKEYYKYECRHCGYRWR